MKEILTKRPLDSRQSRFIYLESVVNLSPNDGLVDEAFVDGEGIWVDVGQESTRNFSGVFRVFVKK